MQLCSGIALAPFSQPDLLPGISREQQISIGMEFTLRAFHFILDEVKTGPSTPEEKAPAFEYLVGMYSRSSRSWFPLL